MNSISFSAFSGEMEKISAAGERLAFLPHLWQSLMGLFRSRREIAEQRAERRVEYHFSPKASSDKWRKLVSNAGDPKFIEALSRHPDADEKLILHAQSMGQLAKAKPVGKIKSSTLPGKTYEIRDLGGGRLGCQCGDWRYKGSVTPGYECKHIKAHKAGMERAA